MELGRQVGQTMMSATRGTAASLLNLLNLQYDRQHTLKPKDPLSKEGIASNNNPCEHPTEPWRKNRKF